MQKLKFLTLLASLLILNALPAQAETSLSGYASIIAGRVSNGNAYLADYPKAGIYDSDWSFSPDTSIGLQISTQFDNDLEFIIQAVSNGASDYDIDLDWAYVNYQINDEFSIQAGRKRLPLYYYSDFFDVGYAYYWIRPPSDSYTWQISNYNGISLQYQPFLSSWDVMINLYAGREDSENNDLLSLLSNAPVDETWKNMLGVVTEISKDWFEFRATYMSSQLDRTVNGITTDKDVNQNFSGISINLYPLNFIILSELNQYKRADSDIHVDTQLFSLGYQIGKFTPHITYSEFKQNENISGGDEHHQTKSIGLKWDINKSTGLKVQFDDFEDKGIVIPVFGDSRTVSLGIDIVF